MNTHFSLSSCLPSQLRIFTDEWFRAVCVLSCHQAVSTVMTCHETYLQGSCTSWVNAILMNRNANRLDINSFSQLNHLGFKGDFSLHMDLIFHDTGTFTEFTVSVHIVQIDIVRILFHWTNCVLQWGISTLMMESPIPIHGIIWLSIVLFCLFTFLGLV